MKRLLISLLLYSSSVNATELYNKGFNDIVFNKIPVSKQSELVSPAIIGTPRYVKSIRIVNDGLVDKK